MVSLPYIHVMKMPTDAHIKHVSINKSDLEPEACHCIMCNKYKNAELAKDISFANYQ